RMLADVGQAQTAFGHSLTDLGQGSLTLLLVLVYVFSLHARLALIVILLAPVVLLPIVINTRRRGRAASTAPERTGEPGGLRSEPLKGQRLIKTYAMEPFEARRLSEANDRYFRADRRTVRLQAANSPRMEVLTGVCLSALFIYAAGQIHADRMQVGDLFSFLAAPLLMYKPLKDVTRINMAMQIALSAARRVFEIIDRKSEIVEKPGAPDLRPFSAAIRYEKVTFGYGAEAVLLDVDLTIRRGETVAL